MNVTLLDPSRLYAVLSLPSSRDSSFSGDDAGEAWKKCDPSKVEYPCLSTKKVCLPLPLKSVSFDLDRNGDYYSASFRIEAVRHGVFDGLSEVLRTTWKERWVPVDFKGCGYVNVADVKTLISIHEGDRVKEEDNPKTRVITIGENGAIARKFENEEQFLADLSNLEIIANSFINAVFGRPNVKKLPSASYDLKLSLLAYE